MAKSEVYSTPAVHTKNSEESRKEYLFRNRKEGGQPLRGFVGSAPRKGSGETNDDTIRQFNVRDGDTVMLTESEYQHIRDRGIDKPVMTEGPGGTVMPTGRTFKDRRFDLDLVN